MLKDLVSPLHGVTTWSLLQYSTHYNVHATLLWKN
jgi:hypothetical protein